MNQNIEPGDRVAFHEDFLRDHPGRRRAAAIEVVLAVDKGRATIAWDLPGLPARVNLGNLAKIEEYRS